MKKMTKKIILSMLTLVITAIALGTTTYAWFTVGGTVAVEEIEMEVTSGVGLEVAYLHQGLNADDLDLNYVKTLNASDLYTYLYIDYYGNANPNENYEQLWKGKFTMDNFTSKDGIIMYSIPENLPEDIDPNSEGIQFEDSNLNTVTWDMDTHGLLTSQKTNGFIEFSLAFRTKKEVGSGLPLYLTDLAYGSNGVNWEPEKTFTLVGGSTLGPGSQQLFRAVNGTRISIQDVKASTQTVKVFEKATNGIVNTQLSNNEPNWSEGAHNYYFSMTNTQLEAYYKTYRAAETITSISSATGEEVAQFKTGAGTYNYAVITVRIYLEGFDSETLNSIFEDVIRARFNFGINLD